MTISAVDFKNRFIRIFGAAIWTDFIDFSKSKQDSKSFQLMHYEIRQLDEYSKKIENRNLYTKGKNQRFARFVLISIERAFHPQSRSINFDETIKLKDGHFNRYWEIEHIFPQSGFDDFFKKVEHFTALFNRRLYRRSHRRPHIRPHRRSHRRSYRNLYFTAYMHVEEYLNKHFINNLTLITRELNGHQYYKTAKFLRKRRLIQQFEENKGLYINHIFKNQSAKSAKDCFRLLVDRQYKLKFNFNRIFKPDEIGIPVVFFRDVLGYSESDIKTMLHITRRIRKWCRKRRKMK